MNLHIIGKFKDTLRWTSLNGFQKIEQRDWQFNQIQDSALNLITGTIIGIQDSSMAAFANYDGIRFMALGSGNASWDADPNNVAKPVTQTTLETEIERIAVTPDQVQFLTTSGVVLDPTIHGLSSRIKLTRVLASNEGNGDLREFGLFGGNATSASDSGTMFNWITHPLIQKDASLVIERIVDIQFSINRS